MEDDQLQRSKAASVRTAGHRAVPRKVVRITSASPADAPERVVPPPDASFASPAPPVAKPDLPVATLPTRTHGQPPSQQPAQPPPEPPKAERTTSPLGKVWAQRQGISWLLGLVSLGLAMLAQKLASDDHVATNGLGAPPFLSWVLYAVAAVIFAIGIPASPPPATSPGTLFFATLRSMRRRPLFLALAGLALLCTIAAAPLFFMLNSTVGNAPPWYINSLPWLLYIASIILFGAAWLVWERNTRHLVTAPVTDASESTGTETETEKRSAVEPRILRVPRRVLEWGAVGGLFVLALALRLPNLNSAPPGFWFDEAQNGIVARGLWAQGALHPTFIGDFTQMGAFYFYVLGLVIKLLGDTAIWPIRLLPALAGSLMVPMLYVIGSRLYGWRVGIAAAALLAVSNWNITFSRFGMATLPTIALDVAVYFCMVQALRTGRLGYYAAGGLLLGIALQMYYASELVPVVLGLVFLHRLITERARFWRSVRAGIAVLAVSAAVAFLPVATFAIQQPEVFTARAGTVSIFSQIGSDGRPDALFVSLNKHALMFNYSGDTNGRHNLPGDPMLDWWTAVLFIPGLGVCLLRIRRWHYFYPLVWFLVALSGGVLSIVFEAPQAHRTVENSVVTALIAGIFLGELSSALMPRALAIARTVRQKPFATLAAGASFVLLLGVLALSGAENIDHYFNHQMNTQAVWLDMLGQDRAIADDLVQYAPTHTMYVSDSKADYAPSVYRAPNFSMIPWSGMSLFPLTDQQDAEILLTNEDSTDVVTIRQAYPNAKIDVLYGPNGVDPELFQINVPASDIAALQGVHAQIFGSDATKSPTDATEQTFSYDWGSQAGQGGQAKSVRLSSTLKVSVYEQYYFHWVGPDGNPAPGSVTVDGYNVTPGAPIALGIGLHSILVTATPPTTPGTTQLMMGTQITEKSQIPGYMLFDPRKIEPRGLTATLRQGTDFNASVAYARVDRTVSFFFHITPLPRPYTIDWAGKIYIPVAGNYTFQTEQISKSRLLIDGTQLIENDAGNNLQSASVQLTAGLHDIRLLFLDQEGSSHMYLYWTPPGVDGQFIIPSAFLLPVMGSYPLQPESGAWPTLAQADDSVWADADTNVASGGQPSPPPTAAQNPNEAPPPPQQAAPPTSAPTPAAQTAARQIQPLLTIGGQAGQTLARPKAAAVDADGNIFIYTELDTSISKFSPDGKQIAKWTVSETDGKPATEISAMVVKDGKLLALDASTSELINFNLDGSGGNRTVICNCFFPRGMSIANDGNFWIADTGGNRVLKVSPDQGVLKIIEGKGSSLGQFVEPAGVWEAPNGTLYVADVTNQRVQSFTPDLKPEAAWPMSKSTPRDGNRVTVDGNDALVTDYGSTAVIRYNAQGGELGRWVYSGPDGLAAPAVITPAGSGKFLVLYPFENVAVVFSPGT